MEQLLLRHSGGETPIDFAPDLVADPAPLLRHLPAGARLRIVTDSNVAPLHAVALAGRLRGAGREVSLSVLPAGEEHKTLATASALLDELLTGGIRRDDRVVAVGGGVVGDVAGFAAALALRGVPCVQVPTTLLAMVDSAVGGKTGVDHATGKNRIGVFSQPSAVVVAPAFLGTLPAREVTAGLAEMVKSAMLAGEAEVEGVGGWLAAGRPAPALGLRIREAVALKVRIVESDEREAGPRRVLNLGHTLGHALEAATGYTRLRHGEAVAWGLLFALRLSASLGILPAAEEARLSSLVRSVGPLPGIADLDWKSLLPLLRLDKKAGAAGVAFVLLEAPGRPRVVLDPPPERLAEAYEAVRSGIF